MQINSENCFKFIDTGTLLKSFMVIITAPASINFIRKSSDLCKRK